jgi:WD40 repeat protein
MLYAVAISPDGTSLAVGGFTGAGGSRNYPIFIFDRESGVIRRTIVGLPEVTNHLAYSKDGRYLAAALVGANGIRLFETAGYAEVARDVAYDDRSDWVEFDQSGRLVTASFDGFVRLYGSDFHLLSQANFQGGGEPFSARFAPDGKLIAVGLNDRMAVDVAVGWFTPRAPRSKARRTGRTPMRAWHPVAGGILCDRCETAPSPSSCCLRNKHTS